MRIYNPSLGRFLSVDPLTKEYPFYSPYHFAGNRPIDAIDLDGLEPKSTVYFEGTALPKINLMPSSTIQYKIPDNAIINSATVPNKSEHGFVDDVFDIVTAIPKEIGRNLSVLRDPNASIGAQAVALGNVFLLGAIGEGEGPVKGPKAPNPNIKGVIGETNLNIGKGDMTSKFKLTETEALDAGIDFVGKDARELGKKGSGVYESKSQNSDGTYNRFRMDEGSLTGKHPFEKKGPKEPHVHFEKVKTGKATPEVNNHVPLDKK